MQIMFIGQTEYTKQFIPSSPFQGLANKPSSAVIMKLIGSLKEDEYAQWKQDLLYDTESSYCKRNAFVLKTLTELEYPEKLIDGVNEVIASLTKLQEDHSPESRPSDDILESLKKAQNALKLMFQKVVTTLEKNGFNIISALDLARMTNTSLNDKTLCIVNKVKDNVNLRHLFCAYINQPFSVVQKLFEFYQTTLTSADQLRTIPNFKRTAQERGFIGGSKDPNIDRNFSPDGKRIKPAYSGRTPGQAAKAGTVNGG